MNRISAILAALAAATLGSAAHAQAGSGGPAPGTVDSKAAVSGSRETREDFNRAAGSKNQRRARKSAAVAATAADVTVGAQVSDFEGATLGTVEAVDSDGAVITTGTSKVEVPLEAFGKNDQGLLLGITKAEFDALVAGATAA